MSRADSSDEDFIPDSIDDSRGETQFSNISRPRTRAYVSNNPDPLASLVGLVDEIKKVTGLASTDNVRAGPAVKPRGKGKGSVLITYARDASSDRVGSSAEHLPTVTADDVDDVAAAATQDALTNQDHTDVTNIVHTHTNAHRDTNTHAHTNTAPLHVNNNDNSHNSNATNMVLSLGEALRLIPCFDGTTPSDIYPFVSACDIALTSVAAENQTILLKAIRTKLRGNAFAITQYREVGTWESLKILLEEEYCAQRTATHIQLELNSTRQREGELISAYSTRIQTLFHKLCNASAMGKPSSEAKII